MTIATSLSLKNLELHVFLGWPDSERQQKQKIALDIDFHFQKPPKACVTDDLADTMCYDQLIKNMNEYIGQQAYRLIEHLGKELYHYLKQQFSGQSPLIAIRLTKQPPISNLLGGVSFCYGDGVMASGIDIRQWMNMSNVNT